MQAFRNVLAALTLGLVAAGAASAAPIIGARPDAGSQNWLIDDAEIVMIFNAKALFKAELLTKGLVADAFKKGMEEDKTKENIKKMGFDPTKDLDSVVLSVAGFGDKAQFRAVAKGTFDKDKITKAWKSLDNVKMEGDLFKFEGGRGGAGKPVFAGVSAKGDYLYATTSKEATADLVKNGATKAAKKNAELAGALKGFTGKEAVAMAMVVNEELKKQADKIPNKQVANAIKGLKTVTYSMTVTSGVDLLVVGSTKDGDAKGLAKQLTAAHGLGKLFLGMAENVPPAVADLYDDIKIDNTRDKVTINLKINKDTIEKMAKMGAGGGK